MADPIPGDIVREKKYAQPLEVTRIHPPTREAEVRPQNQPNVQPKWTKFEKLQPYRKES